jgi:hypothetical protein
MPDTKPPQDDPAQSQRFIDMAREVEATDRPNVFDRLASAVMTSDPHPRTDNRVRKGGKEKKD